jgi:hypothetical protein
MLVIVEAIHLGISSGIFSLPCRLSAIISSDVSNLVELSDIFLNLNNKADQINDPLYNNLF